MKKLVLLSLVAVSLLGTVAQAASSGCPLMRQTGSRLSPTDRNEVQISSTTSGGASRGATAPGRR